MFEELIVVSILDCLSRQLKARINHAEKVAD